jgi:hypothetical protein
VCALLTAGAAQAERVSEPYGKVGDWEITAEDHQMCLMKRLYGSSDPAKEQGLIVAYDAQGQVASLNWVTRKPPIPPLSDALDLDLAFLKKSGSMNESWGSQPFQIQKGEGYLFIHVFTGGTDVQRILRDLASQETIALFFGPSLVTGLHLDASDAVVKLRECASKIAELNSAAPLQR